jgi:hypothetical protein
VVGIRDLARSGRRPQRITEAITLGQVTQIKLSVGHAIAVRIAVPAVRAGAAAISVQAVERLPPVCQTVVIGVFDGIRPVSAGALGIPHIFGLLGPGHAQRQQVAL